MRRSLTYWPLCVICVLFCAIAYSPPVIAQDSPALRTANKAIAGIIKAASNIGATKVCEAVVPKVFCDIVVGPVISAIYEDYPVLEPKKDDSLSESQRKATLTIELLHKIQKYQELIAQSLDKIGKDQARILREVQKLGETQAEIQTSIQSILLHQAETRRSIEELIQRQKAEEAARRTQTKSTLYSLQYKAKALVDERRHLLDLLKIRGVYNSNEYSEIEKDYKAVEDAKSEIDSPATTLDRLEAIGIVLNKFIVLYEQRNLYLKEDLERARRR